MKEKTIKRLLGGLCFTCIYFLIASSLAFGQSIKQYKFTNTHGEQAKDLHMKISPAVQHDPATQQNPPNTFPEVDGVGSTKMGFGTGLTGAGVAAGGDVIFTFVYDGSIPRVKEWWWTKSGDPNDLSNANRLGPKRKGKRGQVEFVSTIPSAGDGLIELTVDETMVFEMPPNLTSSQMASAFKTFVEDGFAFADAQILGAAAVEVTSRAFKSEGEDIEVIITPDSNMEVSFNSFEMEIPTLTEWGVIILTLLMLAMGMVFIYKRQVSLAFAGGAGESARQTKTFLFDKRLFAKVFGITLMAGLAFLGLSFLIFGKITAADPFGTFVSAAIIAYMIQYMMLRRRQE